MIWLVLILLVVLVGLYLMQPFFLAGGKSSDERLVEARAQRASIDLDSEAGRLTEHAATQARDALDRRVLELLDETSTQGPSSKLRTLAVFLVPAVLLLGAASVYVRVGSPSYQRVTVSEFRAAQAAELPQSLDGLVVELRNRLEADPNPPADGYVLLARSYLRLNEIEAALEAYEQAIAISRGAEALIAERDRVIEILRERVNAPEIDPEAAARIQAMTPDEQSAMIESMVEGLAVRLEQNPQDAQGWLRLIRARMVLGQRAQALQDLQAALAVFADDPEALSLFEPLEIELTVQD